MQGWVEAGSEDLALPHLTAASSSSSRHAHARRPLAGLAVNRLPKHDEVLIPPFTLVQLVTLSSWMSNGTGGKAVA